VIKDFVIDLETMDTEPTAAIVAIGAVAVDFDEGIVLGNTFYRRVRLESSVAAGGTIGADTVLWWLNQDAAAREELTRDQDLAVTIRQALNYLSEWMGSFCRQKDARVWGNGASFDNVILRHAYACDGSAPPWDWWNDRCFRTLKNMHPNVPAPAFEGVKHRALDDARHEAQHLLDIFEDYPGSAL